MVAGDVEAGEEFLRQLSPFVWRKYLDFAAVADIHAMKRRVHAFKVMAPSPWRTTSSSAAAASETSSSSPRRSSSLPAAVIPSSEQEDVIEALDRLAAGGWIALEAASELTEAYLFLRRIENRLQMVGDQQTHIIPAEPEELDRVARLSGFADTDEFADALIDRFKRVEAHYEALFEKIRPHPVRRQHRRCR